MLLKWLSKLALFIPGCFVVLVHPVETVSVIAILAALTAVCLQEIIQKPWFCYAVAACWAGLARISPFFVFFWPLLLFDFLASRKWVPAAVSVITLLIAGAAGWISPLLLCVSGILCFIACVLWLLWQKEQRLETENRMIRDDGIETKLALEQKNNELLVAQETNTRLATLAERSRIAREIHDNVGHLLARGMMQTGALITVNQNPDLEGGLCELKETLTLAMNSVRESVHDLRDESFDLQDAVIDSIRGFTSFKTNLNYDIGDDAPMAVKTCFAAVVREALANTARHSKASYVQVNLQEHPGFYQLSISDNGSGAKTKPFKTGMGLDNMRQRAEALNGRFYTRRENGFGVHITIPKNTPKETEGAL